MISIFQQLNLFEIYQYVLYPERICNGVKSIRASNDNHFFVQMHPYLVDENIDMTTIDGRKHALDTDS